MTEYKEDYISCDAYGSKAQSLNRHAQNGWELVMFLGSERSISYGDGANQVQDVLLRRDTPDVEVSMSSHSGPSTTMICGACGAVGLWNGLCPWCKGVGGMDNSPKRSEPPKPNRKWWQLWGA